MSVSPLRRHSINKSRQVVACLDQTAHSRTVASIAADLAGALEMPLVLFHVMEPSGGLRQRTDPLEWHLLRRQAHDRLDVLRTQLPIEPGKVKIILSEGDCAKAISECASTPESILVMGTGRSNENSFLRSRNAREVLEAGLAPVLLIPNDFSGKASWEQIFVPLDGSHFADMALAEAMRLARRTDAELVLAHVVPEPHLASLGPPESSDLELRARLEKHNRSVASGFLAQAAHGVALQGLKARSVCLSGEPRSTLQTAIAEAKPAFVVLSARGQGGQYCRDLPIGSTASYLLDHLTVPTLFVPTRLPQIDSPDRWPENSTAAVIQVA